MSSSFQELLAFETKNEDSGGEVDGGGGEGWSLGRSSCGMKWE